MPSFCIHWIWSQEQGYLPLAFSVFKEKGDDLGGNYNDNMQC